MATKLISTFSCFSYSSSPNLQCRRAPQLALWKRSVGCSNYKTRRLAVGKGQLKNGTLKVEGRFQKRHFSLSATSRDDVSNEEMEIDASDDEGYNLGTESESIPPATISFVQHGENDGKPGFISFYRTLPKSEVVASSSSLPKKHNSILWFVGPSVLVATFIFPSLYLRRIVSSIFEDSLLTDFFILFFTEALFYFGVAVFLFLMDYLWRPAQRICSSSNGNLASRLSYRISSVAILVLSLIIPLVTMGFVWPWTGPAASATLAPYLVGIVVQFTFEQYARYLQSPSWPVIPIIFQVYRLHQLNRAAQLVTALSFTVRGIEMTPHNLAINNSLGTLLNVLQLLGIICIWSLSSFLVRFFPSSVTGF